MATNVRPPKDIRMRVLDRVFDDMIVKNFRRQPKWLQAFVYFLFVAFFIATSYRLIAGDYVVRGMLWEHGRPARNYEFRIGEGFFTTNSKGMYYVVLGPVAYGRLVIMRSTNLPIAERVQEEYLRRDPVLLSLRTFSLDEFDDFDISERRPVVRRGAPYRVTLDSSAYAQQTRELVDRLVLRGITLGADSRSRLAEFKLDLPKQKGKQRILTEGVAAGELPIRPAVGVTFDETYYFEVPRSLRGQKMQIELDDKSGYWFIGSNEDFDFVLPRAPGTFTARGTRKSVLTLELIGQ